MSYFSRVRISYEGDDAVTPEALLVVAKSHIEQCGFHTDVLTALREGLTAGEAEFSDLESQALTDLFRVLSKRFPAVTFWVSGMGEDARDVWTREFLGGNQLAAIGEEHRELYDSVVRQATSNAVHHGFLKPRTGYVLPGEIGMRTAEGNRRVREALAAYITGVGPLAQAAGLASFHQRLAAFQDSSVRTARKRDYESFFGWANPTHFDAAGEVIRT